MPRNPDAAREAYARRRFGATNRLSYGRSLAAAPLTSEDWREVWEFESKVRRPFLESVALRAYARQDAANAVTA